MNKNEQFILQNYKTMNIKEMAEKLNTASYNVGYYLRKNGINTKLQFSDYDIAFMKRHYLDMSYKEIGEVLGYTERQIRGKINHLGLKKVRDFNNRYFQNIDTELKAYFLGFIFADGWISYSKTGRAMEFGMELQSQDKYILDRLNDELGGIHLMTHNEPEKHWVVDKWVQKHDSDILRVFSKPLIEDLKSHGIDTNKSGKDTLPIFPDEFFFDFLRGYIDGDGCFYFQKNKRVLNMHITCASKKVLEWVQSELSKRNIDTYIYCENDKKYRLFCTERTNLERLIKNLYHDNCSLYLTRKYDRVKSYLSGLAA